MMQRFEDQTIHDADHAVRYTPFIQDGRVGYVVTDDGEETSGSREYLIYMNPSTGGDADHGDVFVYVGMDEVPDPAQDAPLHYYDTNFDNPDGEGGNLPDLRLAAQEVIETWEHGDLAAAVRNLADVLSAIRQS